MEKPHTDASKPVQTVICSKDRFKTLAAARKWVKDNGFKSSKADTTESSYRFRQFDPSLCTDGTQRTITLTKGVQAVTCTKQGTTEDVGQDWPAALVEQSAQGSFEDFKDKLRDAVKAYLPQIEAGYGGEDVWCYIVATFENRVALNVYGRDIEEKYWSVAYSYKELENGDLEFSFSDPIEMEWKLVPKSPTDQTASADPPEPPAPAKADEQSALQPSDAALLEAMAHQPLIQIGKDGQHIHVSRPVLLESEASVRQKLNAGERIRGRAPLLVVGKTTSNNRVYTVDCGKALYRELSAFLEKQDAPRIHFGPWPTGASYPTHDVAKKDNTNVLTDAAARFTGLYVESGHTVDELVEGDVIGVYFDMLSTQAGKDTVAILLETNWIGGLSLRGFSEDDTEEADGLVRVNHFIVDAFGGDFVMTPAAPFPSLEAARVVLEGKREDGKEVTMDAFLEELKTKNPELYKQLEAGKAALEEIETLKGQVQKTQLEGAVTKVLDHFRPKLDELPALDDDMKKDILEEFRPRVEAAAQKVVKDRPELQAGTERFQDAVVSEDLESAFKKIQERYNGLATRAAKAMLAKAGIPENAVMGALPNLDGGLPNINRISGADLYVEEDNERVGLPTGLKKQDGSRIAPRVSDVLLSMSTEDVPVFERDDLSGGHIHVLDKYRPGLRAKIDEIMKVYMDVPVIEEGRHSVTYRQLLQDAQYSAQYKQWKSMVQRRGKLEAGESITTNTLPTLSPDVLRGILEKLYAMSTFLNIARIVPCESESFRVNYQDSRRGEEHVFGVVTQGGGFAATGDEGALTYADKAYVRVTTAIGTDAACTFTYTNENGASKTTTLTIPDGTAAGAVIEIYPAVGERILDISGCTVTGWASGAFTILAYEPPVGNSDEVTSPYSARTFLNSLTGTVQDLSLKSEVSWNTFDGANKSLAMHGPGRWDIAAAVVQMLGSEIADYIDRVGMALLNNSTDFLSSNVRSFDATAVPSGLTEAEHKATLLEEIYALQAMLKQKSLLDATDLVINYGDRSKLLWMSREVVRPNVGRAEAFFNNQDWGTLAGMRGLVSHHQNHQRLLGLVRSMVFHAVYVPLQFMGPYDFVSGQTTRTFVARQRVANRSVRVESRGYIGITE